MRLIVTIGFTAALLGTALPAQAADSNTNANTNANAVRSEAPAREAAPQANGAPNPNRQICVREPASETRIRRQICHTAREWRDLHGDEDQG